MNEWVERAKIILDTPAKKFAISGIADDGGLVDVSFSFNQLKSLTDNIPREQWVCISRNDFDRYGIHSSSSGVKFDRQTLLSMRQKGAFVDCIWIQNKINDPWTSRMDWKIRFDLLDKIERLLFS